MNNILETLRAKGKEKKFYFDEKELHEEKGRVNIELQEFIKKIKEAQRSTRKLKNANNNLKRLKEDLTSAVSNEDKDKINGQIRVIIEKCIEEQSTVKTTLELLYSDFIKDLNDNSNLYEQEKRISKNLHGAAVKHFQEVMLEFQSIESELKSSNQSMILRSAEIALSRPLTKEEEQNILAHPEVIIEDAQEMMQAKLEGQAHSKLVNAVRDLQDRHDEIRKLEQNIMQVHKLIEELAGLVKLQGEMVDNICDNIASAKQDVLSAEEDIFKSKKNLMSARKKKCIILIIVTVVLAIIIIPTLISVL